MLLTVPRTRLRCVHILCLLILHFLNASAKKEDRDRLESLGAERKGNQDDRRTRKNFSGESRSCGSTEPANIAEYIRSVEIAKKFEEDALRRPSEDRSGSVTIPVYFHLIESDLGHAHVTDTQVENQIDVMNAGFSGADELSCKGIPRKEKKLADKDKIRADTSFRFKKIGLNRVINNKWVNLVYRGDETYNMQSQLRVGGCETLNVYVGDVRGGIFGWGSFPQDCERKMASDGIFIDYTLFPGGSSIDYGLGDTVTHEVGHWLGLLHTFTKECHWLNDEIDDTPAQKMSLGCPVEKKDSCPSLKGRAKGFNFMDFSVDCCMHRFTPKQSIRMDSMYQQYRSTATVSTPKPSLAPSVAPTPKHSLIPTSSTCSKGFIKVEVSSSDIGSKGKWKILNSKGRIMGSHIHNNHDSISSRIFQDCLKEDCYTLFTKEEKDFSPKTKTVSWKGNLKDTKNFQWVESSRFGCPIPAACDETVCKERFVANIEKVKNICLDRSCRKCDECLSQRYLCKKSCLNHKKANGTSWSLKCASRLCAGCDVCDR